MAKLLIHAGMSPLDNVSFSELAYRDKIGTNSGNLVYAYSIFKTLMVDESTEIIPTQYKFQYSQQEIDAINEYFDAFIIPLADAIRPDFLSKLKCLTKLVRALNIPCHVIGIGVRAPYEPGDLKYDFDEDIKDFISAVLEKSMWIGVRGQITADYLKNLGFYPEKDFTIIGCPSLYTNGLNLKISDKEITPSSRICWNAGSFTPDNIFDFLTKSAHEFEDPIYIPQSIADCRLMYDGQPYIASIDMPKEYPTDIKNEIFEKGHCRFFSSAITWINYLKTADFSFGTRLHGNIVATLAGTPSIIFPLDARSRELVEYHMLPSAPCSDIKNDTDIFDLISSVNFHQPEKVQRQNFNHYLDFLNRNEINHIYKNQSAYAPGATPIEKKMEQIDLVEPLQSVTQISGEELAERLDVCHDVYMVKLDQSNNKIKQLQLEKDETQKSVSKLTEQLNACQKKYKKELDLSKNKTHKLQEEKKQLQKQIKDTSKEQQEVIKNLQKQLNYKSVKFTLKIRNEIEKIGIYKKIKSFFKK